MTKKILFTIMALTFVSTGFAVVPMTVVSQTGSWINDINFLIDGNYETFVANTNNNGEIIFDLGQVQSFEEVSIVWRRMPYSPTGTITPPQKWSIYVQQDDDPYASTGWELVGTFVDGFLSPIWNGAGARLTLNDSYNKRFFKWVNNLTSADKRSDIAEIQVGKAVVAVTSDYHGGSMGYLTDGLVSTLFNAGAGANNSSLILDIYVPDGSTLNSIAMQRRDGVTSLFPKDVRVYRSSTNDAANFDLLVEQTTFPNLGAAEVSYLRPKGGLVNGLYKIKWDNVQSGSTVGVQISQIFVEEYNGISVYSKSNETGTLDIDKMFDGVSTTFAYDPGNSADIIFDFGSVNTFSDFSIMTRNETLSASNGAPTDFSLQVQIDDNPDAADGWITISDANDLNFITPTHRTQGIRLRFAEQNKRYFRWINNLTPLDDRVCVSEMQFGRRILAIHAGDSASAFDSNNPLNHVGDGDPATFMNWGVAEGYIVIDALLDINEVIDTLWVQHRNVISDAFPRNVEVYISSTDEPDNFDMKVGEATFVDNSAGSISEVRLDNTYSNKYYKFVWTSTLSAIVPTQIAEIGLSLEGAIFDCGDVGAEGYIYAADINGDCYVNVADLEMLALNWLSCTDPTGDDCEKTDSATPTYTIAKATSGITVDGNTSDWPIDIEWIQMDDIYAGNPSDLTSAKWAMLWDDTTNKIYALVVVEDGYHAFEEDPASYNTSDRIEVYSQASGLGGTYNEPTDYKLAQHYMIGANGLGGTWTTWGSNADVATNAGFEAVAVIEGNTITYEIGCTQFIEYAGIAGGLNIVKALALDDIVRFDIAAGSIVDALGNYGMLAENTNGGKYFNASAITQYQLVNNTPAQVCGDWGYSEADINQDCKVDLVDYSKLAEMWLDCNDPADVNCVPNW